MIKYIRTFTQPTNLDDALTYIKEQMKEFHPAGYSTSAKLFLTMQGLAVEIERFESCD